jgi:hypothetical protein
MTPEEIESANHELIRAYQLAFNSPAGQAVLIDLMAFCSFRKPIAEPVDEGKRQVMLRIMNLTQLSMDQLMAAYRGQTYVKVTETEDE